MAEILPSCYAATPVGLRPAAAPTAKAHHHGIRRLDLLHRLLDFPRPISPSTLEQRGFNSLWRRSTRTSRVAGGTPPPGGGELAKRYYDVMDPFVTLTAAAAATKNSRVATGICLVIQRDTIQTAKLVASIDQVTGGRSCSASAAAGTPQEIEAHGTVFATRMKKMREQIEAMKEIWTKSKPRI